MTATHAGSYDVRATTAGGLTGELERLEQQAELSFAAELGVFEDLGLFEGSSLLEIGAGSGAVTRRLHAAHPDTALTAFDIDGELLAHAEDSGATLVVGDALDLPFPDGAFDAVLLRYVLQHVADPVAVLAEARRVVRPGGVVVAVEVDNGAWGIAEPSFPELGRIHAAVAAAQAGRGGTRTLGRRLSRDLRAAGFDATTTRAFATTSDDHPMAAFAPHLGPQRLLPLVASGHLTLADLALATDRWSRYLRDPDAWVMLLGYIAAGRVPAPAVP